MEPAEGKPVVGILYPGEMGSSLGQVLKEAGFRVITTLTDRSARTRQLSEQAGLENVRTFAEVVRQSQLILSAVPPAAALEVARRYAEVAHAAPQDRLFLDVNSVSPETAQRVAAILETAGVTYVDGAIHGLASQLRKKAALYVSGTQAARVANLFGDCFNVHVVGDTPVQASTLKMILAGVNKGLVAIFLEMALLARQSGLLEIMLNRCRDFYPGVMGVVERLLPTYPRHASRRADEMHELERTLDTRRLPAGMAQGAQRLIAAVGRLNLAAAAPDEKWTVDDVIEAVYQGLKSPD